MKRNIIILMTWWLLIPDFTAFAQENSSQDKRATPDQCRLIEDNMQRLLCFDALFDTPLAMTPMQENTPETTVFLPSTSPNVIERPIGDMVLAMEQARPNGFEDWQIHIRRWQGGELSWEGSIAAANLNESDLHRDNSERNPIDIFMTMKQAEIAADRPKNERAVLLISCDNDITTLGVLLPQPINTLSANLVLSGPGGVVHRLNWRNVESGSLVIAGRGLESIDTIKAIANYPRIQFQVAYPDGPRAFVFNMRDLKAHLRPFRIACHW